MAGEVVMSFTGTLGADPEIRQAGNRRVLSVSIAQAARVKRGDQWEAGETWWFAASLWERFEGDPYLDNVAASLRKGDRVDVRGAARFEVYETRDGGQGTKTALNLEAIAPSLQYARAQVAKNPKPGDSGQGAAWGAAPGQAQQQGWGQQQAPQAQQAWGQPAVAPQQQAQGGWPTQAPAGPAQGAPAPAGFGGGFENEEPF